MAGTSAVGASRLNALARRTKKNKKLTPQQRRAEMKRRAAQLRAHRAELQKSSSAKAFLQAARDSLPDIQATLQGMRENYDDLHLQLNDARTGNPDATPVSSLAYLREEAAYLAELRTALSISSKWASSTNPDQRNAYVGVQQIIQQLGVGFDNIFGQNIPKLNGGLSPFVALRQQVLAAVAAQAAAIPD